MGRRGAGAWPYAVCGLLAAGAGMAAGHFVAAFTGPEASPVLAVGSAVIDSTPTPVKEWAVQTLGNADKPILLATVALVTAAAAVGVGLVSRRRPTIAQVLLVLLAGLAGAAALTRSGSAQQDVIPSLAAAGAGAIALAGLRRLAISGSGPDRGSAVGSAAPDAVHESPLDHTAYAAGAPATPPRRTFLLGAAGVTAGAGAVGALGQSLSVSTTLPADLALPTAESPIAALPAGIEGKVRGVSPFRTPVRDFYRVDTALVIPRVDASSWTLEVGGRVDRPFKLSFRELLELPMIENDITLNCVSNEVGGPYISSTRWLGVRVRDLLERAGVQSGVDQILSESTDGMTISTPIEALTDDRDALVAVAMDGRPLPAKHGFPARLVTPGLYGYVGATKWLARLTATTYDEQEAYWTERGWAAKASVKTQSRIDTPHGLDRLTPGQTIPIAGVAWAQGRGIDRVQVRVDDGEWMDATLGPEAGIDYWRQWYLPWTPEKGTSRRTLTVRATDGTGEVQTEQKAEPFPSGASGYHSLVVQVS